MFPGLNLRDNRMISLLSKYLPVGHLKASKSCKVTKQSEKLQHLIALQGVTQTLPSELKEETIEES